MKLSYSIYLKFNLDYQYSKILKYKYKIFGKTNSIFKTQIKYDKSRPFNKVLIEYLK